ncbi:ComEA family DNA-binding protein [Micromonospora sp. CP22]|nr:ComEA family DNA-binding protein [Micromonospora sp. CP22]
MPGAADLPADAAATPVEDRRSAPAGLPPSGASPPDGASGTASPPVTDWPTVLLPLPAGAEVGDAGQGRAARSASTGGPVRAGDEEPLDAERERTADEASPRLPLPGPGAFDPGRRGVRALAAVAVSVVLAAGIWAWRSRPQVEPVVAETGTAVSPAPSVVAGDEPSVPETEVTGELVVAVAGKVRRPGLVRLAAGARVADALDAAGGALPGVDVAMLNPARRISDGELIVVGVAAPTLSAGTASGPGTAPGGAPVPGGRVNLNTATSAQLETLPGVGPVLAQRIIEHRDQHGGFRSVGDLRRVSGIGDARYEQLKDLVTV